MEQVMMMTYEEDHWQFEWQLPSEELQSEVPNGVGHHVGLNFRMQMPTQLSSQGPRAAVPRHLRPPSYLGHK
jgi:hypothetical protein